MGSPEWFKFISDAAVSTKLNLQPRNDCKVMRSVFFAFNAGPMSNAKNTLTVSFPVSRVKYSIVAKCMTHNANAMHAYLISSSLTGDMIGSVSGVVADVTETQTHEFIYQTPREFSNETLSLQMFNTADAASALIPTNFTGVITLLLELSNY
jgi:hypothetical protein